MNKLLFLIPLFIFALSEKTAAQKNVPVESFDKVIVSPHVQVTFTKGDKEAVTIQNCTIGRDKVHIESKDKTLRVYLEGEKDFPANKKVYESGRQVKKSLYTGTVLTVVITYKDLEELSIRGEETILLKSKLDQENFILTVYGESKVYFDEVQLKKLRATIYGESYVEFKAGDIAEQRYTSYGESEVKALAISGKTAKATLYGEAKLNLNVSDEIKVTAYGEAKVGYKGNPQIRKGLSIGGVKIYKID
ncbi:head GIN domain-containing protein [Pedobacter sp. NJ-S-72]